MNVVENATQNAMEDITFLVAASLSNQYLHSKLSEWFPDSVDEKGRPTINYAREGLEGFTSILWTSALMYVIRREELIIGMMFTALEGVIAAWWLKNKGYFDGMVNKIKSLKGVKATSKAKTLTSQTDPTNAYIGHIQQAGSNIIAGRQSSGSIGDTINTTTNLQSHAIRAEAHDLKHAKYNNDAFAQSIMLKLATGNFTPADEMILRKVIGRSDFSTTEISTDELNKVHEFFFIKDVNGKVTGLSKAFMSLVNAYGKVS